MDTIQSMLPYIGIGIALTLAVFFPSPLTRVQNLCNGAPPSHAEIRRDLLDKLLYIRDQVTADTEKTAVDTLITLVGKMPAKSTEPSK